MSALSLTTDDGKTTTIVRLSNGTVRLRTFWLGNSPRYMASTREYRWPYGVVQEVSVEYADSRAEAQKRVDALIAGELLRAIVIKNRNMT